MPSLETDPGPGARAAGSPNVLLVTPSFFGYERAIAEEFEAQGARVTVIDERPGNASWLRATARVAPALLTLLVRRHFRAVLRVVEQGPRVDLLVVVKGEVVPRWFLRAVRRHSPQCVTAFYGFDSFANSPRGVSLLPDVDHALTFEKQDVSRFPGVRYQPLFFTTEFDKARGSRERSIDLAFVGTVHSGRWDTCRQLFAAGRDTYGYFYSPARWHHALMRLVSVDVRRIPWRDVSFTKLSRPDVAEVFAGSRAVIDVQRSGQSGLTMRTFEVLAAGAKLVTTNAAIVDEPLFDPRWVLVLPTDRAEWDLARVTAFVRADHEPPRELLAPYALAPWVGSFLALLPAPAPLP